MDEDGSNHIRLTNHPAGGWSPSWSPDGSRIAFLSARDGNYGIYVMNTDGSDQTLLANYRGLPSQFPSWSPDGQRIAFWSGLGVYVIDSDGSNQTRILTNSTSDASSVTFDTGSRLSISWW